MDERTRQREREARKWGGDAQDTYVLTLLRDGGPEAKKVLRKMFSLTRSKMYTKGYAVVTMLTDDGLAYRAVQRWGGWNCSHRHKTPKDGYRCAARHYYNEQISAIRRSNLFGGTN